MEIDLTSEQADFVRLAQKAGRVSDSREAVQQAMGLWVDRERRRSELVADLDDADAALARGEGIDLMRQSVASIVDDVMRRSRGGSPQR